METLYELNPTLYFQLNNAINRNDIYSMKKIMRQLLDIRCDENRHILVPIIRSVDNHIYNSIYKDTKQELENDSNRFARIMNNNDQQLPRHIQQHC